MKRGVVDQLFINSFIEQTLTYVRNQERAENLKRLRVTTNDCIYSFLAMLLQTLKACFQLVALFLNTIVYVVFVIIWTCGLIGFVWIMTNCSLFCLYKDKGICNKNRDITNIDVAFWTSFEHCAVAVSDVFCTLSLGISTHEETIWAWLQEFELKKTYSLIKPNI